MTTIHEIPAYQLDTTYRIMLKRIGKGYTAAQLTFLIGAPEGYIQEIEALERPFYTPDDLARIAIALEECNPDSLCSSISNEALLKIAVTNEYCEGSFVHAYYRVNEEVYEEELFRLYEEEFSEFDEMMKTEETFNILNDIIDVLTRTGYFFEPKLPYEIFKTINNMTPEPLSSYFIQSALDRYLAQSNDKLRLVGSSQEPYCYEQC